MGQVKKTRACRRRDDKVLGDISGLSNRQLESAGLKAAGRNLHAPGGARQAIQHIGPRRVSRPRVGANRNGCIGDRDA
ncbi:hypothetical protein SDC9_80934 [bioreactor metagenome]|uniref:Uncharacterized protein n=1 Tax=bioreactor metagenome TaxID=1076179 RepID=A0A644Z0V0_9ZZZZ